MSTRYFVFEPTERLARVDQATGVAEVLTKGQDWKSLPVLRDLVFSDPDPDWEELTPEQAQVWEQKLGRDPKAGRT